MLALVALPDNQLRSLPTDNTVKLFNVNDGAVLRSFAPCGALPGAAARRPRFVSGSDDDRRIVEHGLAPLRF